MKRTVTLATRWKGRHHLVLSCRHRTTRRVRRYTSSHCVQSFVEEHAIVTEMLEYPPPTWVHCKTCAR